MASSLSLSFPSSSLSRTLEHDVFPSFRGEDVRQSFLSHILKEFRRKAINVFIDDEMKRGEFIDPELKRAIRESKIAVVLLSKNYASSSWCLDELVEIMKNKLVGRLPVITIFYEVDPTDVKKQKGDFGKVFKKTCKGKDKEKVQTWRKALEEVATITGYHSYNWVSEATMIEKIAADISNKLNYLTPSREFDQLIGMGAHMERMNRLLQLDLDEVSMIGIWGPPGIGKSTIARFLYDQLSGRFQNSALMVNIRASYPRSCLDEHSAQLQLQKQMLSEMIDHDERIKIPNLGVAQARLRHRKVLLILDDVDRLAQLEALAKNVQWFGPGSRIIITTQDLRLFRQHGIKHIYKVNFPSTDEALQMFCMYAFDQKSPKDGYGELAREITWLVGELPLALKVMGSHFRGLSKDKWSMEVSRLRTNLNGDIESVLKLSYDALCDEDKDLFLLIACFYNGKVVDDLFRFGDLHRRLYVLEEKSLISMFLDEDQNEDFYTSIHMHNLLVQLGKKIVRKDGKPGQRKFLSDYEDICEVITTSTGSVICIQSEYHQLNIIEKALEGISNLQYLIVTGSAVDHQNIISSREPLTIVSPKLRLLEWPNFPMTCLRFTKDLDFLVALIMPRSKLEKLWDGIKLLRSLKKMDLSYSENLKELPNLSKAKNLEELDLKGCSSLVELPSSIGHAISLKELYLYRCSSLVELPSSFGNLTNLSELDLCGCSSLVELPSSIGNLANLTKLDLSRCSSLVELPSSFGNLANLSRLSLNGCSSLVELPSSIGNLTNLKNLNLRGCSSLVSLPQLPNSLKTLNLSRYSSLVSLSSSIGNLTNLKNLHLNECSSLVSLPQLPDSLKNLYLSRCASLVSLFSSIGLVSLLQLPNSLKDLILRKCSSLVEFPSSFGNLANLSRLSLNGCSSLVELPSSFGNLANLSRLSLIGCSSLVSLPQLPDSLNYLTAENCGSLEKLDGSLFCNPCIEINFCNCFKLNKEARDLIIQTSTRGSVVLPGKEVPAYFAYRAYGSSVTVKLNQKLLRTSTKFKACILFDNKGLDEVHTSGWVTYRIMSKKYGCRYFPYILEEHLYILDVEAEEVTSTELVFDFEIRDYYSKTWKIKECGIIHL